MLRRLRALFDRHAAARLRASISGPELRDAGGRLLGRVERVRLDGGRLRVEGWARPGELTLRLGGAGASARPNAPRPDLPEDPQGRPALGFAIEIARPDLGRPATLGLRPDGAGPEAAPALPLPLPSLRRARLALLPRFSLALLAAAPDALRWRRSGDPAFRARVKRRLGLEPSPGARPLDLGPLAPAPEAAPEAAAAQAAIAIVLPVFNAFDLLPETLGRVLAHTDLPWTLILVEDASTDPRIRPFLRGWAARHGRDGAVVLIENETNLGFIGSVNRGLDRAAALGRHVVLLNSDALVPAAWASRLVAPLLADPAVASVTPMSNDAEILSAPVICARLPLAPGAADAVDRAARSLDPLRATAEAPTGVGFCMALSRAALDRLPAFDTAFGRGYGEEVDWCQRARALGLRHLASAALFVEHRGGESFGSAAKRALVAQNNALVARRYPAYDGEVQGFIAADPLRAPRLLLGLAWAQATDPDAAVPIYLAHAMGGGAELDLRRRIARGLARGRPAVVLRLGGESRWQIELHTPSGVTAGATGEWAALRRLLAPLRRRAVVYSCAVGDPDPAALPDLLLSLLDEAADHPAQEARLEILLHDHFPVSPSYSLLDSRGRFGGVPLPGGPGADDPAHQARRPDGRRVPLGDWQAAWGRAIARAEAVTAFSASSRELLLTAYPWAADRVRLRPHPPLAAVAALPAPPPGAPRVLGVLGNIGFHKGAAVVQTLGRLVPAGAGPRRLAGLVVVGNIDPDWAPPARVAVLGDYRLEDLAQITARQGITDWLIPSIWPETFCFTVREALATGLPTYAFALGAQGEAVAAAANGRPIPFDPEADLARAALAALLAP